MISSPREAFSFRSHGTLKRWLALMLGVGLGAAALYAVVAERSHHSGPPAHREIDAASRARLDRVIERADEGKARPGERR